ncbi:MAG: hypothetical protein ACI4WM_05995 [Erysipelotrichaceae bacterium]
MSVKTINEYSDTLDDRAKTSLDSFMKFMESAYPGIRLKISF